MQFDELLFKPLDIAAQNVGTRESGPHPFRHVFPLGGVGRITQAGRRLKGKNR
jgi:hypothetical protein